MLWEPTRQDMYEAENAFLQVEYLEVTRDELTVDIMTKLYGVDRLVWFAVLEGYFEERRLTPDDVNEKHLAQAVAFADDITATRVRFMHYGSPLEIVLSVAGGTSAITFALNRVITLWASFRAAQSDNARKLMLGDYYRVVREQREEAFESQEAYQQFITAAMSADYALDGASNINTVNVPPAT